MRWLAPELRGCAYVLPGQVRWLVAEPQPEGSLCLEDGGVLAVEEAIFPPPPDSLTPLFGRRGVAWSFVVPLPGHSALARLPDLSARELTRGIPWEAEKVFRLAEQDPVYDFELLAPVTPANPAAAGPLALLIALRRAAVEHWREWSGRLATTPARLEPAFTAALRRLVACTQGPRPPGPFVYVQQDEGNASVIIFADSGAPLSVRNLALGARRRGEPAPLSGEEGIRALRETLLHCEDRHPMLSLETLTAVGEFEPEWLEEASLACQLTIVAAPAAPTGVPPSLAGDERWCVPHGGLLGF